MYNMDEKGFVMGVALCYKFICKRGQRLSHLTQDGIWKWVTVIEAVSGDGQVLHPMIINKRVAHYMGWYAGLKEDHLARFGVSQKGWSNEKLGLSWLKYSFDPETKERYALLFTKNSCLLSLINVKAISTMFLRFGKLIKIIS